MASVYPTSLDSLSTAHVDNANEIIHASTVNDLADAVNKIEAELGTNPSGAASTVAAAITALGGGGGGIATPLNLTQNATTDAIIIDRTSSDTGKLSFRDYGSDFTGLPAGANTAWFRVIRADAAGYISRNALFTGSTSGGSWAQDDANGISLLEEFGEGNWGIFMAPDTTPSTNAVMSTVLNAEFSNGGLNGDMIVHVPNERLYVGKTRSEVTQATIDAELRVIVRSNPLLPLYVRGTNPVLGVFAGETANTKGMIVLRDGPDVSNHGYLLFGIDNNGGTVGFASGGAFISSGANGTGTPRSLVLHTPSSTGGDIVMTPQATERWRLKANGVYPGKELDYAEITSAVNITSLVESSSNTIITGNAVTYDGTTGIIVSFYCPYLQGVSGQNMILTLWDGGTNLGRLNSSLVSDQAGGTWSRRMQPASGSHTFSVKGFLTGAGTGQVGAGSAGAGLYFPAYLRTVVI